MAIVSITFNETSHANRDWGMDDDDAALALYDAIDAMTKDIPGRSLYFYRTGSKYADAFSCLAFSDEYLERTQMH